MAAARSLRRFGLVLSLWMAASCGALAQAQDPSPEHQAMVAALTRANDAVVGIEVTAAEGASSAASLGMRRRGSGVVIGADGLILTIGYLMLEADAIQVVTRDNRRLPARSVAYDIATGFGLVRPLLPLRGVEPVALAADSPPETGEALLASAGGEDAGVALTRLVSRRAFSGYWEYHIDGALFTSPPVGNHSGAALFNRRGELLGIGSLFVGDALGDNRRLPGNMFVPVDLLKPILGELEQTGSTRTSRRPWLGLTSTEQGGRVQVVRVNAGSPAQAAGLAAGDVVLAIDGKPVSSLEAFYKQLWSHANPDDEVRLTIQKGDDVNEVTVKGVDRMTTMRRPRGI